MNRFTLRDLKCLTRLTLIDKKETSYEPIPNRLGFSDWKEINKYVHYQFLKQFFLPQNYYFFKKRLITTCWFWSWSCYFYFYFFKNNKINEWWVRYSFNTLKKILYNDAIHHLVMSVLLLIGFTIRFSCFSLNFEKTKIII